METTYIKTPLGIARIEGDENGVSAISVLDEGTISISIPEILQNAVSQLNEYFEGKRLNFDLKLNPKGDSLWENENVLRTIKSFRRCQSHSSSCFCQWKKPTLDCSSMSSRYWI